MVADAGGTPFCEGIDSLGMVGFSGDGGALP